MTSTYEHSIETLVVVPWLLAAVYRDLTKIGQFVAPAALVREVLRFETSYENLHL